MNSQPHYHVHFTEMFIPSPWCELSVRGVLLIKMARTAAGLCRRQEQVCRGSSLFGRCTPSGRCTVSGCGVWESAGHSRPHLEEGSDLPQTRSGKWLTSFRCRPRLVRWPTRGSYGSAVSASLDPTSSRPCPRKKKRIENFMQTYDFQSQLHR